ncbi:MAG TPA: hypothetical protein VFI65_18820 [Streptosporangiaceae bacterium]|nr:hypothetical protein [Streptosporangiaceae bacterium]
MTPIDVVHEQLRAATGVPGILDAAYRAFMTMLPVLEVLQDRGGPSFAAVVSAGTEASSGRFALDPAPSLSAAARAARPTVAGISELPIQPVAKALAELGGLINSRLAEAYVEAENPLDRLACIEAGWYAYDLSVYLGGAPPT